MALQGIPAPGSQSGHEILLFWNVVSIAGRLHQPHLAVNSTLDIVNGLEYGTTAGHPADKCESGILNSLPHFYTNSRACGGIFEKPIAPKAVFLVSKKVVNQLAE